MDHERKSVKVAESSYQVLKVALSIAQEWITKERGVKFRSLYIKCFKFSCLCIISGSPKKKFKMRSVCIKCLKLRCICGKSGSPKIKL